MTLTSRSVSHIDGKEKLAGTLTLLPSVLAPRLSFEITAEASVTSSLFEQWQQYVSDLVT